VPGQPRLYRPNHDSRLEIFNSIIAYHPSDNPNLIYALLRTHRTFEDLGTFTLARGLRDVRRIQRTTEEQSQDAKGKSRAPEGEYDQAHEEKQRMLQRENALGISSNQQSVDSLTEIRVIPRDPHQDAAGQAETPSSQVLTSPSIEQVVSSAFPTAVSEKARGKMRERRSASSETEDSGLDRVTASAVGWNGFVPTQEWASTFLLLLSHYTVEMIADFAMYVHRSRRGSRGAFVNANAICPFLPLHYTFLGSLWTR
jgi:hypothetical protein